GLDLNRFAGGRIAAHARGTLAHLQDSEPANANALALFQVLDDVSYQAAQNGFGLLLRNLVVFREARGEMLQCHCRCGCHVSLLQEAVASKKAPLRAKQLNDSASAHHAILPIPPMFSACLAYLVRFCGKGKALLKCRFRGKSLT